MVGARARGFFEDVVVRRAPGFMTASSIERERRERIHIEKKASARKRETSSRLSRKGSNLVANRRKMFETGIGPRTRYRVAISCLSFPFI